MQFSILESTAKDRYGITLVPVEKRFLWQIKRATTVTFQQMQIAVQMQATVTGTRMEFFSEIVPYKLPGNLKKIKRKIIHTRTIRYGLPMWTICSLTAMERQEQTGRGPQKENRMEIQN